MERSKIYSTTQAWTIALIALLLCTNYLAIFVENRIQAIAILLLILLPGYLCGLRIFNSCEAICKYFLAASFSLCLILFTSYILVLSPVADKPYIFLVLLNGLSIFQIYKLAPNISNFPKLCSTQLLTILAILLFSFCLRFYNLGESEFQGDEARAIILATAAVNGQPEVLFTHKKGPAEVLFPATFMLLTGHIEHFSARLPFAFAGVLLILGTFAICKKLRLRPGILNLVAFGCCLDGFLLAFSRIVQYQALLVVFCLAAILCALELAAANKSLQKIYTYTFFSALFFSSGLYSHYDTIFILPLILYLIWQACEQFRNNYQKVTLNFVLFSGVCCLICGSFFIPLILNQQATQTAQYLGQRLGLDKLPTNNLGRYWQLLSFYQSIYLTYFVVAVLSCAVLLLILRSSLTSKLKLTLSCFWLYLILATIFKPELLAYSNKSFAILIFSCIILYLLYSKHINLPTKTLIIWIAPGLAGLGFLFARPNTHFYVVHLPLLLACGLCLQSIQHTFLKKSLLTIYALILCSATYYAYIAFIRLEPQYRHHWAKVRPSMFPLPFKNSPPGSAFFGFPHRAGWQVIGALYQSAELQGSYDSNEEPLITAWYTRAANRISNNPDYYFISYQPNDPVALSRPQVERKYNFWGRVYVDGIKKMDIYSKLKPESDPKRFDLNLYSMLFDQFKISELKSDDLLLSLGQSR